MKLSNFYRGFVQNNSLIRRDSFMVTFFGLSKKAGPPEKNGASTPESLPLGSKGRLEMAAGALQSGADNDTSAPLPLFI